MRYMTTAERGKPGSRHAAGRFFAEPVRDYVLQHLGSRSACSRRAAWRRCASSAWASSPKAGSTSRSPPSTPTSRCRGACCATPQSAYDDVITGDLRTVPIPQRAYDVVYCALLLERVRHVELVLDRLTSALKPGGLLLVRTGDRYSATALLDRLLPRPVRRAVWSRFRPGIPGPFPPVYEKAVSEDGIAAYALMHGLVIAARGSELTRPGHRPGCRRRCGSPAPPSPG